MYLSTNSSTSRNHMSGRAFGFPVRRGGRASSHVIVPRRRSSSEAGKIMPAYAPALVRQPTTHLHSQVAFDRITRPSASSKDPLPHPSCKTKQSRISRNTSQPSFHPKVSADNLEFLQRPNGDSDLPVAAPIEPLGGGDPAPDTEPVEAPKHHEETHASKPAPSASETKPAKESQSNGTPVESKPAEPQSADMSYADMAAKGPKQTDEEKYVTMSSFQIACTG
jgi:hypothetical protein